MWHVPRPEQEVDADEAGVGSMESSLYHQGIFVEVNLADDEEGGADSHVLEWYNEDPPDLTNDTSYTDLEHAKEKIAPQFLAGIHGHGSQKHQEALTAHLKAEGHCNHHKLGQLFHHAVPHTLDGSQFLPQQGHQERSPLSPDQWREVFSGITPRHFDSKPKLGHVEAQLHKKLY